jgi:hypothetical protein
VKSIQTEQTIARTSYYAHATRLGWKDRHGRDLPPWEALPEASKDAWLESVKVAQSVINPVRVAFGVSAESLTGGEGRMLAIDEERGASGKALVEKPDGTSEWISLSRITVLEKTFELAVIDGPSVA